MLAENIRSSILQAIAYLPKNNAVNEFVGIDVLLMPISNMLRGHSYLV